MNLLSSQKELQALLASSIEGRGPGAAVGIYYKGVRLHLYTGTSNQATQRPMSLETSFLVGSVTKVYTATLALLFVQEGRLALDAPVRQYLPEFSLAETDALDLITIRHLINHSSGIDGGDYIADFGWGDGCIARYVESCAALRQLHGPGQFSSYCNAGYVILGRVLEVLTQETFDDAIRQHLLEPFGLTATSTTRSRVRPASASVGHIVDREGLSTLVTSWTYPRACGPAGSTLYTSIEDFLSFAVAHLDNDSGVIGAETAHLMRQPQFEPWFNVRGYFGNENIGLPWRISIWEGRQALFHSGGSPGGAAYCLLIPEEDFALVTYANWSSGNFVAFEFMQALVTEHLGITPPDLLRLPDTALEQELRPFFGTFERLGRRIVLSASETGVQADIENLPVPNSSLPVGSPRSVGLKPINSFSLGTGSGAGVGALFRFIDEGPRGFNLLETGRRISKRI